MHNASTVIAGVTVPSDSPLFLATVAVHVAIAVVCIVAVFVAMLSTKQRGRHSSFGTLYFWCLCALVLFASTLAIARWHEDYPLFLLGIGAVGAALVGRRAVRWRPAHWARVHLAAMGTSVIFMLIAFYVDNGPQLPLWRDLPSFAYWLVPMLVGVPIIAWAWWRHPLARGS